MIAAIILAAGLSSRMGVNKLALPFGDTTVIEQVVKTFIACDVKDIVVVTGHEREKIETLLNRYQARCVHNAGYAHGEMFSSIQTGLRAMSPACSAALVTPGDYPLIEARVVTQIIAAYLREPGQIVIPSYLRRGGHPILIDRGHWRDILSAPLGATLRDVIRTRSWRVHYVDVDTESAIRDMDTPDQYREALVKRAA
jgi:molybdenum cofactor cytidylyltransferase